MKNLYDAAKKVVAYWERGDLALAVRQLAHALNDTEFATPLEIKIARNDYHENGINIDDDALVTRADPPGTCWVQAWVRIAP